MAGDSVHWLDCSYLEALVGELSLGTMLVSVVLPEERHRRGEIGRRSFWKALFFQSFPVFVRHHEAIAVVLNIHDLLRLRGINTYVFTFVKEQHLGAKLCISLWLLH